MPTTARLQIINGQSLRGDTPFIGANGNWWIADTDTGVPATQDLTDLNNSVEDLNNRTDNLDVEVGALTPIVSTTDIAAGSAAPEGRPYHVIE